MSFNVNKVFFGGRLTRDVELRYTPKGTATVELGMASDENWKDEAGDRQEVCYAQIVVFGKQAESAAQFLKKGSPLLVEGRLKFEEWEKNGEKRRALKILASRVQFLGSKNES